MIINNKVNFLDPSLDPLFHALSDVTRRRMVLDAHQKPHTAGELARPHSISLPAISKHLKVLENAGLVHRQIEGKTHIFTTKTEALVKAQSVLNALTQFWHERLNELEDYIDQEKKEDSDSEQEKLPTELL